MAYGSDYSTAYDSIYHEKNYAAEAAFVLSKVSDGRPAENLDLLDMGCGTGVHAVAFAQSGAKVSGIDLSHEMLRQARRRADRLEPEVSSRLTFKQADIRDANIHKKFDAITSLFHVLGYMASDEDLSAALQTARRHLRPGGLFLFDFWYGPAVLAAPPESRERRIASEGREIIRTMTPEWFQNNQTVAVNYVLQERDLITGAITETNERHLVRYYFVEELARGLAAAGFSVVEFAEFLTGAEPNSGTFSVYCLVRG